MAVDDFNRDGKIDLAVANLNINTVSILLGTRNGTFAPQATFATEVSPEAVVVGDFNGDTKLDLAVPNRSSNSPSLLLGNGDATFAPAIGVSAGNQPNNAAGDFNGDNKLDLAVANYSGNDVSVSLGNGNGTFAAPVSLPAGTRPDWVAARDFDGDGRLDLATANVGSDNVTAFLGNGNGTFSTLGTFATGVTPAAIAGGDVNGDAAPDLVTANIQADTLSLLPNLGGTTTSLSSTANPVNSGGTVTLSATVHPTFSAAGTPAGTVTFRDGATPLATVPLANSSATFSTSSLAQGTHTITAVYNGDGNFNPSTSPPLTQIVRSPAIFVTGADAGGGPDVKVFNADGSLRFGFFAFDASFTGGVRVASGDVNGDGFPVVIVAAGPGGGPNVRVFDGRDGKPLTGPLGSIFPYDPRFSGGVFVAAGDVNGDGRDDILSVAGPGGGADVRTTDGLTLKTIDQFFAYDPRFTGGLYVSASH